MDALMYTNLSTDGSWLMSAGSSIRSEFLASAGACAGLRFAWFVETEERGLQGE